VNPPSLRRRLLCNLYETLLLAALLFIALFPFAAITQALPTPLGVALQWIYLFAVGGVYFSVFWRKGQTLAMKTWHIRIEAANGEPPSLPQVWLRYGLACLNLLLLGLGWWSALIRKDGQFLQDRMAGTQLKIVTSNRR
jgi:uncharacterized RDD family membrane protein YckC